LPPVSLLELGGAYFVIDGNHRVSVARFRGVEWIDAEVIESKSLSTRPPRRTIDASCMAYRRGWPPQVNRLGCARSKCT